MEDQRFADFAFQIGDVVQFKQEQTMIAAMRKLKQGFGRETVGGAVVIAERLLQQCHGGVQRMYGVRLFGDGGSRLNWIAEVELVKFELPGESAQ